MGRSRKRRQRSQAVAASTDRHEVKIARNPHELETLLRQKPSRSGQVVNSETAMQVAAVHACVRLLSESIAMLPIHLHDTSTDVPRIIQGPLDDLVAYEPNPIESPYEFKRALVVSLLTRGDFFALKFNIGNPGGRLIALDPDAIEVEIGTNGRPVYKHQLPNGSVSTYQQKDILHVRGIATDGLRGMSVIRAAAEAIGLSLATEAHGSALFQNGAAPGTIIEHPAALSDTARKHLRESFDVRHAGVDNAFRTMVLEEGMKVSKLGMTSEEVQFIESRKFQRSEIAMFFSVPPHMIGDVERGTSWGSGIEQQGLGFVKYTLRPWLTNIQQALNRDLLTREQRRTQAFKFLTDDLTQADFKTRQEGLRIQYDAGVLTREQWAALEGIQFRGAPIPSGEGAANSNFSEAA
jgi:HK97 family phage portal protein